MPSQSDVKKISDGKATPKRRFDARDWAFIAEYVIDTWNTRKNRRKDRERHWEEIDRQLAMIPDVEFKKLPNGKVDTNKLWMAEMELPLQAQALEVLNADARRFRFPDVGPWFRAHTELTDDFLDKIDFGALILGDKAEVPSQIDQDNADKLAEGFLLHHMRQYDFETRTNHVDAEAFKYGMGVARARMETKNIYIHESRGVKKEKQRIPIFVPVSIKKTYLDDTPPSMHSAQSLGQAHIIEDHLRLEDLILAANKGSTDPDDEDGGWMPANLKNIEADDDGFITLLEMEGDIVVPRKTTRSMTIPGAIVTVVVGSEGKDKKATKGIVRFRFRKQPFSSYLLFPYHHEHIDSPYATSPLEKGRPVQIMATDALNRLMDAAMLKNAPPVGYDRNDQIFAAQGGPIIHPYAKWGTIDNLNVHTEVGGDPSTLANTLTLAINLYAELTGILPARLGAQTVSHTTAFAKDAELQRGSVRTVNYVRQTGKGAMTRWLDMAYKMGREALSTNDTASFYIDAYGGYVDIGKDALPEKSIFEWFGAGGPAEEAAKNQARLNSLNLAAQMDQISQAQGNPPTVNIPEAIKQVLRDGKWTDIDTVTNSDAATSNAAGSSELQGIDPGLAGVVSTALQTSQFGNS